MSVPSEDAWTFDTSGWLHLPAVLSTEQVALASNHAMDQVSPGASDLAAAASAAPLLRTHPALLQIISELSCGETKYRLDHPARLLPSPTQHHQHQQHSWGWLNSDAVEDAKRLGYGIEIEPNNSGRKPQVRGVRVLWVLEDTQHLGVVSGSHKGSMPPPAPDLAAEMKALLPLPLRAGDLVIAAATTLLAWVPGIAIGRPKILELVLRLDPKIGQHEETGPEAPAEPPTLEQNLTNDHFTFFDDRYLVNSEYYLGDDTSIHPPPPEMPPWFFDLSPEQQAAVGGHAGMSAVESDGVHARLKPPPRVSLASTRHEAERWFFDVHGYLVIPEVMDAEWLGQANAAVDIAMGSNDYNEFNSGGECNFHN